MATNSGIYVDYFGTGEMQNAFHPEAKLAYIQGTIDLPEVTLTKDTSYKYVYDFTLPTPIANPFLFCGGMNGVDSTFTEVDAATGKWSVTLQGRYSTVVDSAYGNVPTTGVNFRNPVTRKNGKVACIFYGGFRG